MRNLRRQLNEERARHVIELKDQRLRLLKVTEPQAVARNCNLRQERERVVAEQRDVLAKKHQTENTQQERLRLAQEQRLTKELQRLQSQLQKARENKGLSGRYSVLKEDTEEPQINHFCQASEMLYVFTLCVPPTTMLV